MNHADLFNAALELVGGIMLWTNVFALKRDKMVKGTNVWTVVLFNVWGFWNLYYYPTLNQPLSFLGGLVVVSANTAWVLLAFWYRPRVCKKCNGTGTVPVEMRTGSGNHRLIPCSACWGWYTKEDR